MSDGELIVVILVLVLLVYFVRRPGAGPPEG